MFLSYINTDIVQAFEISHPHPDKKKTKWPPFRRQYLQMHFYEWKNILYFD